MTRSRHIVKLKKRNRPNQRKGAPSNSHIGAAFEKKAIRYFKKRCRIDLDKHCEVKIRIGNRKRKAHKFDLGSAKLLVECKSHRWTASGNTPSAKIAVWNEAMYLFYMAPRRYCKVLFVLRHYSKKKRETLCDYYLRTNSHLIPTGVGFIEYNESLRRGCVKRRPRGWDSIIR